jgi:hypothetical protein
MVRIEFSLINSSYRACGSSDIEELGRRIDRLYELSSKGVHADVSEFEVNLCVMGTYNIAGALLRLHAESSATMIDPADLEPGTP